MSILVKMAEKKKRKKKFIKYRGDQGFEHERKEPPQTMSIGDILKAQEKLDKTNK